jgi:uncharacterized protein
MTHPAHPGIVKRLNRLDGHLHMIIAMIEEGRRCRELAQQLHAVENTIDNAKQVLIRDPIEHCLDRSMKTPPRRRNGRASLRSPNSAP